MKDAKKRKELSIYDMAYRLNTLGYKDYIASRFLINGGFIQQGLVLASTAVEKYLKLIALANNRKIWGHLDKWESFKKELVKANLSGIIEELDESFLQLLSIAYKLRYFDFESDIQLIGFMVNQILGELDFTINRIEVDTTFEKDGTVVCSYYKNDVERKYEVLFLNNFVLNGLEKKEFMERPAECYLYMFPTYKHGEMTVMRKDVKVEYNGKITTHEDETFPFRSAPKPK